ncbi:MAG: DUF2061 domain-containing protein [Nanobdellota archaeon]
MAKKREVHITSTPQRSFLKAFTWEVIAFVITLIAVYLVYGNLKMSIKFTVVLSIIKILFLYIHERIWKKIMWGKITCPEKY